MQQQSSAIAKKDTSTLTHKSLSNIAYKILSCPLKASFSQQLEQGQQLKFKLKKIASTEHSSDDKQSTITEQLFIKKYKDSIFFKNHIDKLLIKYQSKLEDPEFLSRLDNQLELDDEITTLKLRVQKDEMDELRLFLRCKKSLEKEAVKEMTKSLPV